MPVHAPFFLAMYDIVELCCLSVLSILEEVLLCLYITTWTAERL